MNFSIIIKYISFLILLSNVLVISFFILFAIGKLAKGKLRIWKAVEKELKSRGLLYAFLVSLGATVGSLFLSEIAQFEPCKLCWFQRIFMYPLPFILGVSLFFKKSDVFYYALPLIVAGAYFAIYHYYLQFAPASLAPCTTVGISVSCSERVFTHFGYITIPWMSFSSFVLIFLLLIFSSKKDLQKTT